jgi:hypothetical protein
MSNLLAHPHLGAILDVMREISIVSDVRGSTVQAQVNGAPITYINITRTSSHLPRQESTDTAIIADLLKKLIEIKHVEKVSYAFNGHGFELCKQIKTPKRKRKIQGLTILRATS